MIKLYRYLPLAALGMLASCSHLSVTADHEFSPSRERHDRAPAPGPSREFSASRTMSGVSSSRSAGNSPSSPEPAGWGDADFERNQSNAENGTVDTSVDSCSGGCETPTDVDTSVSGGGLNG